jgi:osmotically-inducible protein OsmY
MINSVEPPALPTGDRETAEAVRRALALGMPKAAQHITVTVEQGVVHLWGVLASDEEAAEVRRIVATLPHVRAVRDHRRDWSWS